jgi:hypothetical protein
MIKDKEILYLRVKGNRPDFRIVKTFIWGELHKTDSDGDSNNPASRTWTELYIASREVKNEYVDIYPVTTEPLVLKIQSPDIELTKQVTLFLAEETAGDIFADETLSILLTKVELMPSIDFNEYRIRKERTKDSVWRQSTLENPYPNISV